MERLDENAQWIMLIAIIVCVAIFFLAFLINESVLVGKTTAESVLDFPKADLRDIKSEILRWNEVGRDPDTVNDIEELSLYRKNAIVTFVPILPGATDVSIHYNNGLLKYDEKIPF